MIQQTISVATNGKRNWFSAAIVIVAVVATANMELAATAATYYVSASGNDSNDGLKPETAWKTIAKVQGFSLQPGDIVLFEGGQTFNGTIKTASSGTAAAPIRFSSYGSGMAGIHAPSDAADKATHAIYFNSNHFITVTNLDLSAPTGRGILISANGSGTSDIVLDHLRIHDCGDDGLNSSNPADARVTLSNSLIANVQGCGVFLMGSSFVISKCSITNTGLNTAGTIKYPLHGVYGKGPQITITDNVFTDFQVSGISLRYNGNVVENNKISAITRGTRGICYYQETDHPGTTRIINNTISGVTMQGIAIDNGSKSIDYTSDKTTASTTESFLITRNSITMKGDTSRERVEGMRLYKVPSATLNGNVVWGTMTLVFNAYRPTGAYSESANTWQTKFSDESFMWNGVKMNFNKYRIASGQATGDVVRNK